MKVCLASSRAEAIVHCLRAGLRRLPPPCRSSGNAEFVLGWWSYLLILIGLSTGVNACLGDTFIFDATGRAISSVQANGLTLSYAPDGEANLLSVSHISTDTTNTGGPGNGIPDWWEYFFFGVRGVDPLASPSGDGIGNLMKFALGLNPTVKAAGPIVGLAFQLYADGKTYPYLTYVRSKDAAGILYPQQSTDGVGWQSGASYFVQTSVHDLGNGTEQIVIRCLTALPAASNLSFRLKADAGITGIAAYYVVNPLSGPPGTDVPLMPGWSFAGLGLLLALVANRFFGSKSSARTPALLLVLLLISSTRTLADDTAGPGWRCVIPLPLPAAGKPGGGVPTFPRASPLPAGSGIIPLAALAYSGPSVTAVTPELQALATGLYNDPLKIFNYVRNKIQFQPYYGCNKGAHVTYLDGAGNDFDQASLLVALLNQAGFTTTSFVYGQITVPDTTADGNNLGAWLGMSPAMATFVLYNSGIPFQGGINYGPYIAWTFDHVWVRATINGTTYDLDPSFKQSQIFAGIDYKTASGYSRSQLLADAGGTVTADYVQNLNRAKVETRLAQYTANLRGYINTNYPNAETEQIFGGARVLEQPISALAAGAPLAAFSPAPTSTFTSIPSQYVATYRVQIDSDIDVTFSVPSLQGNRLSVVFSGANAQLWLSDTLVAQQSSGSGGSANVTLSITHPYASLNQTLSSVAYLRTGSYDLTYAFFSNPRSNGLIDASSRQLQSYLAAGLADTSRQVLTETLHSLGLKWVRRVALETAVVGQTQGVFSGVDHIFGRSGQETGYYVDMPGVWVSIYNTSGSNPKAFNASAYLSSAMEHGVIEQTGGSASLSTVKCLALANDAGQKIFKATSLNYGATVSPQLLNYSSGQLSSFNSLVNSGYTLLLHQNGQTGLNRWNGFGYAGLYANFAQMIIGGGYSGGFNSLPGLESGSFTWQITTFSADPFGDFSHPTSPEPVDLLSGAYTMKHADLALGEQSSPRGLNFTRYYDSSRNFAASTLGNGWRHSCEGKITLTSELDNAFGLIQPTDAAQTIVGVMAVGDFVDTSYTPQEMMAGVLAANWTVNRILNNSANVQLGSRRLAYMSQPDGSWNPPPGSTSALVGSGGAFTLLPRFGGSIVFDAKNRVSQWKDVDNNTQTYTYDTVSGRLSTVTDSWGRTLSFNYYSSGVGSGLLQNVQDSTGRSVHFGYTAGTYSGANLTLITDPENYNTTLVYDAANRLTDWKDHSLAEVVHNDYDIFNRVSQQLSQNISAHAWKFHYSPGQTFQIDPVGGESTYLFDFKNRQIAAVDALGHSFSNTFDGQNHLTVAVDATGRRTSFTYDGNQNLVQSTDNGTNSTTYQYDSSLRLSKITDATGRMSTLGYDGNNHLISVTDPGARQTQLFYRNNGLPDRIIDSAGNTTTYSAYDAFGNVTSVTRADGTAISATYNALGDRLTLTDGRGKTTAFAYDKRRLLKAVTDARSGLARWAYDSNGHLSSKTDRNGHTVTFSFDNLGHVESLQAQDTGAITSSYDPRDWLTGATDGLGHGVAFGYDSAGRQTSVTNALSVAVAQLAYDPAGRLSTRHDGLGNTEQYFYDIVGRLDHTIDPLSHETDYGYDTAGRPVTLKNRLGNTFQFGYSADGLASTFSYPTARRKQVVDRDPHGFPKTLQSPSGRLTSLTYDAMGRVKTRSDGAGSIAWTFDNEGNATDVKETIGSSTTTIHRVYDELGRVTSCTDSQGYTVAYTYDNEGNLGSVVYPGNKTVTYTYDGANRLKSVTDWTGRVTTYTYDAAGRLQMVARPNNTRQRVVFDAANRLSASYEELMSGGTVVSTLWQATYGYDNANRIASFIPVPLARTFAPPSVTLGYDADNRLTNYNGLTVASDWDGNLLSAPVQGTLVGTLGWDQRNRLTSAGGVNYLYDAENRWISSAAGGQTTRYVYSRGPRLDQLLVRQNPDGSLIRYVYGVGLLYEVSASSGGVDGSPVYYHFDWRGDTVALSDSNGNVTARMSYSLYGERTIESGTVTTPFCFNGKWGVMTEASGLLCMQARFYSPVIRRFLNEDPAGFAGGINLYAFASGDPVDLMDPFGLGPMGAGGDGWTSFWGGVRAIGGGLETAAGIGLGAATSWTGIGLFAGSAVALHGADELQAGLRQLFTGESTDSLTSSGLQAAGVPTPWANGVDAAISIVGTAGAGWAIASANATETTALRFTQTTASPWFSAEGKFAGQTISDVAAQLRAGTLTAADVPVTVVGDGLIVNTRSSLALTQAGIPQSQWSLVQGTAQDAIEIAARLSRNGLGPTGTDALRITGSGSGASTLVGAGTIPRPGP